MSQYQYPPHASIYDIQISFPILPTARFSSSTSFLGAFFFSGFASVSVVVVGAAVELVSDVPEDSRSVLSSPSSMICSIFSTAASSFSSDGSVAPDWTRVLRTPEPWKPS